MPDPIHLRNTKCTDSHITQAPPSINIHALKIQRVRISANATTHIPCCVCAWPASPYPDPSALSLSLSFLLFFLPLFADPASRPLWLPPESDPSEKLSISEDAADPGREIEAPLWRGLCADWRVCCWPIRPVGVFRPERSSGLEGMTLMESVSTMSEGCLCACLKAG